MAIQPNPLTGLTDYISELVKIAGMVQPWIPMVEYGIEKLYQYMKKDNPQLTRQQHFDHLRSRGQMVEGFSDQYLAAEGYVQDAQGQWSKTRV